MLMSRAAILSFGAVAVLLTNDPVHAQEASVQDAMRQCATIDDPGARLSCYDSSFRERESAQARLQAQSEPQPAAPVPAPAAPAPPAPVAAQLPQGFGADDVKRPERFDAPTGDAARLVSRIASIRPREPGVYLLTLEDGAQWLFSEGVRRTYRVPRPGDTIEIESAALDSYLLRFDGQAAVRVRRIR